MLFSSHWAVRDTKMIILYSQQPSSRWMECLLTCSLSLCVSPALALAVWVCAHSYTHTQPLKQELMNLHDFSPAACSALWVSLSQFVLFSILSLSLSLLAVFEGDVLTSCLERREEGKLTHISTQTHTNKRSCKHDAEEESWWRLRRLWLPWKQPPSPLSSQVVEPL